MLRIGSIGYRGHARRIIDLIQRSGDAEVAVVFHPEKGKSIARGTTRFEELLGCDAVLVLSPTDTHFDYLMRLSSAYEGYVFCEKPPVSSLAELAALTLDKDRIFFNFNQRYGVLARTIRRALDSGALGKPVSASIAVGHGLAFKPDYPRSWRADARRHPHGVTETLAIHYIDLAALVLGDITEVYYRPRVIAGSGTAFDCCDLFLSHRGGAASHVFATYAGPLVQRFVIYGTNGIVGYDNNGLLSVKTPRDTFDQYGAFADPPTVEAIEISPRELYEGSLAAAVDHFLDVCRRQAAFSTADYDRSLMVNRLIAGLPAGAVI